MFFKRKKIESTRNIELKLYHPSGETDVSLTWSMIVKIRDNIAQMFYKTDIYNSLITIYEAIDSKFDYPWGYTDEVTIPIITYGNMKFKRSSGMLTSCSTIKRWATYIEIKDVIIYHCTFDDNVGKNNIKLGVYWFNEDKIGSLPVNTSNIVDVVVNRYKEIESEKQIKIDDTIRKTNEIISNYEIAINNLNP